MKRILLVLIFNSSFFCSTLAIGLDHSMVTRSVQEDFEYIIDNVRNAIIGRGMNIANELHASEMLNRTAPDLGIEKNVFLHAESIQFCSALISHRLVAAHPSNMVLCPFTISIYVLSDNPDTVFIAYRSPAAGEESAEILKQVEFLLDEIVMESLE